MLEDLIDVLIAFLTIVLIWWVFARKWGERAQRQADSWRTLSSEIGAEFIEGGFLRSAKVVAKVKDWTITLDTFTESGEGGSTTYTRIRAPYMSGDGFQFKIYRKGFVSKLGKHLGMQDSEIGHPEFDRDFIIKSNEASKVRALFANPQIRQLIQAQPSIYFKLTRSKLYFKATGVIKDVARLKALFELFEETLQQLSDMGSAYETKPIGVGMSRIRVKKGYIGLGNGIKIGAFVGGLWGLISTFYLSFFITSIIEKIVCAIVCQR